MTAAYEQFSHWSMTIGFLRLVKSGVTLTSFVHRVLWVGWGIFLGDRKVLASLIIPMEFNSIQQTFLALSNLPGSFPHADPGRDCIAWSGIKSLFPVLIPNFPWRMTVAWENNVGRSASLSPICVLWPQFKISMFLPSSCPMGCALFFKMNWE